MPLPIASSDDLNIPPSQFNEHSLAVLVLRGGRYGGDWDVQVVAGGQPAGEFRTSVGDIRKQELMSDPEYPTRAAETMFVWLVGETRKQGLRIVGFECLNDQVGEAERPFFCLARAIVAGREFEPTPGVTYADEMTLDAAMVSKIG